MHNSSNHNLDEYYEAKKRATEQAKQSSQGSMPNILLKYWPHTDGKLCVNPCPSCGKRDKFSAFQQNGTYFCKCHYDSCELNQAKEVIGLIQWHENLTYPEACDRLCEYANIPLPRKEDFLLQSKNKAQSKPEKTDETKSTPSDTSDTPETLEPKKIHDEEVIEEETNQPVESNDPLTTPIISIPENPEDRNPWEEIWSRLSLREQDANKLKEKRGFDDEIIHRYGFKSSIPENKQLLEGLEDLFEVDHLLELGILQKNNQSGETYLNKQLHGFGFKSKDHFDWTQPILIPYIDHSGRITFLRPHKGGISGKYFIENHAEGKKYFNEIRQAQASVHPYNALHGEFDHQRAVITEGENKAVALAQAGIPAIALPGIHMIKNEACREELVSILRKHNIKELIVVFDKEDKTHRPEPEKRYVTEAYAQITCSILQKEMFYAKWAELPEEWMVDKKADWDSRLAHIAKNYRNPKSARNKAYREFSSVIKSAVNYQFQHDFFSNSEKERIIRSLVIKHTYEPNLKSVGKKEVEMAHGFGKCHEDYLEDLQPFQLRYQLLEAFNCYYTVRPFRQSNKEDKAILDKYRDIIDAIKERLSKRLSLVDRGKLSIALKIAQIRAQGEIKIVSDFTIRCDYIIRSPQGTASRLLRFTNKRNEQSELVQPSNSQIVSSQKFCEFCFNTGSYNWLGGERELRALFEDVATYSAGNEIHEIDALGYHAQSKLYFFGDCAFTKDDEVLFPDKSNIIWHNGLGYRIDMESLEGFAMKLPPTLFKEPEPFSTLEQLKKEPDIHREEVGQIIVEAVNDFCQTTGSYTGSLFMMGFIAYAFHPEIFQLYKGTPGIWAEGVMGSGKTENCKFAMMIWGFPDDYQYVGLGEGTTPLSVDRIHTQYSCMPFHLDEFREKHVKQALMDTLRYAYNRQGKTKCEYNDPTKTRSIVPKTIACVSGEGNTNDAATQSRYISIPFAKEARKGTEKVQTQRYERMMKDSHQYYKIMRYIMMHRSQLASDVMDTMKAWMNQPTVQEKIYEPRARLTYGVPLATFMALNEHFQLGLNDKSFLNWTIEYAADFSNHIKSINFINAFWQNVMSLYQRDSRAARHIFFITGKHDEQGRFTRTSGDSSQIGQYVAFESRPLYDLYEQDRIKSQDKAPIALNTILADAKTQPYYIKRQVTKGSRSHRIKMQDGEPFRSFTLFHYEAMPEVMQRIFHDFMPKNKDQDERDGSEPDPQF